MSEQVSSTKKLVSASALMASGTLISRALGLIRVMLIAFILGNGTRQADMFALATMVPNSLYILFAGGALNTVLVPQIVRAIKNDADGGQAYTNRIMTAFMLIVGAVAVLVTLGAPLVTMIYTSEQWRAPELAAQYSSMVLLTYLTLPQVFFYGAFFLLGQVLNARDKFGPMMWAPIANNVISVIVLSSYLVVWGNSGDHSAAFTVPQAMLLGLGSTAGIMVQTLVLIPFIRAVGFKLRPRFDLKGTGLGKTFSLTKWTIGFVAVNQVALMVVNRLATSATAGGAGAGANVYANAHLMWILPHSLITVSLATAMLPNASRLAAAKNYPAVAREATTTMRLALILLVPAAAGFFALAPYISQLLFGHGEGSTDALMVGWALMSLALGLIPFTIQFVCLRTFYALEDTRTPFLIQCGIAGTNALGAIVLVYLVDDPTLVAAALGLSYSVAYLVGVCGSWQLLHSRLPALNGKALTLHVVRLLLGAAPGAALGWWVAGWVAQSLGGTVGLAAAIVAGLVIMGVIYLAVGKILQVRELRSLTKLIRSRGGRRAPAVRSDADDLTPASKPRPRRVPTSVEAAAVQPPVSLVEDLMPTQLTPALTDADLDAIERTRAESWLYEETDDSDSAPQPESEPEGPLPDPGNLDPSQAGVAANIHPAVVIDEEEDSVFDPITHEGTLLNTRFRVEELLSQRGGIETWRAHDTVLSRDVVAHVIAVGDPRIDDLLAAARKGAVATDSRFLRVLDAVKVTESHIGAYIVCEFARGATLQHLLSAGPLSGIEAAWITRELSDAMASLHAQGLFHEQISPETIVVTTTGAVRLVGFGLESVIRTGGPDSWRDKESADVTALAKVLYACLVTRWPGADGYGMTRAPKVAGELAPPHTVMAGISPALDRICSASLTQRGAPSETRITTAAQLTTALTHVLGTADAAIDLEDRVKSLPGDDPTSTPREPSVPRRAARLHPEKVAPAATLFDDAEVTTGTVWGDELPVAKTATSHPHEQFTVGYQATPDEFSSDPAAIEPDLQSEPDLALAQMQWDDASSQIEIQRPNPVGAARYIVWILAAAALVILLVALGYLFGGRSDQPDSANSPVPASSSPVDTQQPWTIVAAQDFDPSADNGNGEENPQQVRLAYDGDDATGWSTLRYHNQPELGGLKPGVGLVLDLGEKREIGSAELLLNPAGATVELRIPSDSDATTAPMNTQANWEVIASAQNAATQTTMRPQRPVTTRFVLIYFTKLPPIPDEQARFLASLNEVRLLPES